MESDAETGANDFSTLAFQPCSISGAFIEMRNCAPTWRISMTVSPSGSPLSVVRYVKRPSLSLDASKVGCVSVPANAALHAARRQIHRALGMAELEHRQNDGVRDRAAILGEFRKSDFHAS